MDQKKGKLQLINKGSNSEIYLYGTNANSVILKVVSSSSTKQVKHLANESNILKLLEHKNIIKMLKYQQKISLQGTGQNKQFLNYRNVLVMENAKHGSLLNFIRMARPSIKEVRLIFLQICHAIRYLHCNYFVHRDLKLENILVTQGQSKIQIKLADFGFANSTKNNKQIFSNSLKGTKRAYMAPQIHNLLSQPNSKYNTLKTDIFALGVILFSLIMGRLPFQYAKADDSHYKFLSENDEEGFWKLHATRLIKIQNQQASMIQDFKKLFQQMVNVNPQKRPDIQEVCQSVWLQGQKQQINLKKLQLNYQ